MDVHSMHWHPDHGWMHGGCMVGAWWMHGVVMQCLESRQAGAETGRQSITMIMLMSCMHACMHGWMNDGLFLDDIQCMESHLTRVITLRTWQHAQ